MVKAAKYITAITASITWTCGQISSHYYLLFRRARDNNFRHPMVSRAIYLVLTLANSFSSTSPRIFSSTSQLCLIGRHHRRQVASRQHCHHCHHCPAFVIIFVDYQSPIVNWRRDKLFVTPGDTTNPDIHTARTQCHLSIQMSRKCDSWHICTKNKPAKYRIRRACPNFEFSCL